MCSACKQRGDRKCSRCKTVIYCSEQCQKENWSSHKTLCNAIDELTQKRSGNNQESSQETEQIDIQELKGFVHDCPPKTKTKVVKLIGQQCVVNCLLDDISAEVLWDTGAQVSLVHTSWLNKHFPWVKLRSVTELIEGGVDIKSASGSGIPILGWVPLKFKLPSKEEADQIISLSLSLSLTQQALTVQF